MATIKADAAAARTTGIDTVTIAAGANYLGSEIDNATNEDLYLNLELSWQCTTAATENYVVECYILYALDGTNYEDGGVSVDPKTTPATFFVDNGLTTAQQKSVINIPLAPYKFKILLKSELDQTTDTDATTLLAFTHNAQVV